MEFKQEAVNHYFSSLNSMCRRLCEDIQEIQENHKDLWDSLSLEEQNDLLMNKIVKRDASLKYPQEETSEAESQYAIKVIVDDNCTYRDEHSGPFSFRTASQRDLTFLDKKPLKKTNKINKSSDAQLDLGTSTNQIDLVVCNENLLVDNDREDSVDSANSLGSLLPKTGLDLLDNW